MTIERVRRQMLQRTFEVARYELEPGSRPGVASGTAGVIDASQRFFEAKPQIEVRCCGHDQNLYRRVDSGMPQAQMQGR
jgi:hypothetical protein